MQRAPVYSIDTSALVDWWVRYYPPKNFGGLVPRIEDLISEGRLRASREVRDELEKHSDELFAWAKKQPDLFVESDEKIQTVVRDLMRQYYNPARPEKGISGADPFVIGLAATMKPQACIVVTAEKSGSIENPKIPWVCDHYRPQKIEYMSFLRMVANEKWNLK